MQSLVFLACSSKKVSKKNLWGVGSTSPPPSLLGKGRVKFLRRAVRSHLFLMARKEVLNVSLFANLFQNSFTLVSSLETNLFKKVCSNTSNCDSN